MNKKMWLFLPSLALMLMLLQILGSMPVRAQAPSKPHLLASKVITSIPYYPDSKLGITARMTELLGYWDAHGYPNLIAGQTTTVTPEIQALSAQLADLSEILIDSHPGLTGQALVQVISAHGYSAVAQTYIAYPTRHNEDAIWALIRSELDHGRPLLNWSCDPPDPSEEAVRPALILGYRNYPTASSRQILIRNDTLQGKPHWVGYQIGAADHTAVYELHTLQIVSKPAR
jgi:hypothetical protein